MSTTYRKERCFTSAEELLAQPKLADAIFICTQDQDHVREALMALEKGYHILMEKPISPSAEDCNKLLEASRKYDRKIVVCHVLRYTPFFSKIKEIISEGTIGRRRNDSGHRERRLLASGPQLRARQLEKQQYDQPHVSAEDLSRFRPVFVVGGQDAKARVLDGRYLFLQGSLCTGGCCASLHGRL